MYISRKYCQDDITDLTQSLYELLPREWGRGLEGCREGTLLGVWGGRREGLLLYSIASLTVIIILGKINI